MGRRSTAQAVLTDLPTPTPSQCIARVLEPRGGGVHEIYVPASETRPDSITTLASLPTKFRKLIWVKRGNYVIAELIDTKSKIGAEIVHVLFPEHIKNLKRLGLWPKEFEEESAPAGGGKDEAGGDAGDDGSEDGDEDEDDDLFENPNRRPYEDSESDEDQ
ncbi:putative RNA-binding protein eif1ad [Borealophlyctis nickersoniae]|nr:putative RNA-binding protein eif1ad [Borealophlyctis nickersoniae]